MEHYKICKLLNDSINCVRVCDNAYNVAKGTITVKGDKVTEMIKVTKKEIKKTFKNNAPFRSCL